MFKSIQVFIFFALFVLGMQSAHACESCTISRLGKDSGVRSQSVDGKWFFEYLFEQKNYQEMDPTTAHNLHHQGHEVHDKTTEDIHRFTVGSNLTDALSLSVEMPYVTRRSLEVDTHSILGSKQKSEGLGDVTLWGNYRLWQSGGQSLGTALGVKLPTGDTGQKNSLGQKFEVELQPGSGSVDYIVGGFYKASWERVDVVTNLSYVFNTEGSQDFKFGNMLTASVAADYVLNPTWNNLQTKTGVDVVLQNDWKEEQGGVANHDSGGFTAFVGPTVNIGVLPQAGVFMSVLYPVFQDLGGVHQHLDYVWTVGAKVSW